MIQRIQSVYLFICLLLVVGMFLSPIAEYLTSDSQVYEQNMFSVKNYSNAEEQISVNPFPVGIMAGSIGIIFLISIFLYKKRNLQIRLLVFNMVLLVGLIGLIYFYTVMIKSEINAEITYGFINLSPVLALLLSFISFYRIRLDEALIKSADRIR